MAGTLLTGCFDPIEFTAPDSLLNSSTTPTWHGPSPVDLEDVRDSSAADFFKTLYPDTTSLRDQATVSYAAFEVANSAIEGALVGSFYNGTRLRPFGRAYSPYSFGGTGWATSGTRASYLDDSAATNDAYFVSLGFSPAGAGFALFSDGTDTSYTGNIQLKSEGIWSEIAAQVGATLTLGTLPGNGYLPNPTDGYAANGSSIATAWDSTGHAYYGYVDESDGRSVGYVNTYTAFTSWATGNGVRLGPLSSQLRLHNDGFGMVPVWLGQDSLQASSVSFGAGHSCAITAQGLKCWGLNTNGQTGDDATSPVSYPAPVDGIGGTVTQVEAGTSHTCAVTQAGSVLCWGINDAGQIGTGSVTSDQVAPQAPSGITGVFREVASGATHSCARTATGTVSCWGGDASGQIGNGAGDSTPAAVTSVTLPGAAAAAQIGAGNFHTCALTTTGLIYCWGEGTLGQIGNSASVSQDGPILVPLPVGVASFTKLAVGGNHACALTNLATVYCWGAGTEGQLGDTTSLDRNAPVQVAGLTGVTAIAAGRAHSCALTSAGVVSCWGNNIAGQIGNNNAGVNAAGATVASALPTGVTLTAIAAGSDNSAAITAQGQLICWGDNATEQCNGNAALAGATVVIPLETAASANQALHATTSTNLFAQVDTLSTGDVKSMSAATDGQGNVVVVFLQTDPGFVIAPTGTISTAYTIRGNDVRVFAAMRGASGIWTGPTRIDDAARFSTDTTTVFQDAWGRVSASQANITGGIEYPTPAVTYLGEGRFLAAFAMTDLVASKSSIYTRGYSVGSGWDSASQIGLLDSLKLNSATTIEAYRFANDLFMTGNGQGDALLVAHVVVPSDDGSDVTLHNYGMKSYIYSRDNGGWLSQYSQLIPSSICRASADFPDLGDPYLCWGLKPQGMIFPGGEAVVVFPAPASATGTGASKLRLYSTELRQ